MDEQTILSERGVTVTTTRIVMEGRTYATRNVTAVALQQKMPSVGTLFLAIFGIGLIVAGQTIWGVLVLAGSLVYAWILVSTRTVVMTAGSGQIAAMQTHDKGLAQRVHDAVVQAIAQR